MTPITYKVAYVATPSKNRPGYFNIDRPADQFYLSCDPAGNVSWTAGPNPDENYQQFQINGAVLTIRPTDDQNPNAPTIVLLPSDVL